MNEVHPEYFDKNLGIGYELLYSYSGFDLKQYLHMVIICVFLQNIISSSFIKKYHAYYIPMNIFTLVAGGMIAFLIENSQRFYEAHSNGEYHKLANFIDGIIPTKVIYYFFLPPIVLAEGINISKVKFFFSGKKLIKGFLNITFFLICMGVILHYSMIEAHKYWDKDNNLSLDKFAKFAILIPMSTTHLHGALAPLHSFHNEGLEMSIELGTLIMNNLAQIAMVILEKLIEIDAFNNTDVALAFMHVGIGSVIFGLFSGFCFSKIVKKCVSLNENPAYECLFVIQWAYLTYAAAHLKMINVSGDVSILIFAIICRTYNLFNFSKLTSVNIVVTFNFILEIVEAFAFFALGLTSHKFYMIKDILPFVVIIVVSLLLSKFLSHTIVWLITRCFPKRYANRSNFCSTIVEASSGQIKGPLAFVLVNMLSAHNEKKTGVVAVTSISILFCHVVYQPFHYVLTKWLLPYSDKKMVKDYNKSESVLTIKIDHKQNSEINQDGNINITIDPKRPKVMAYIDKFMLKPMLIRNYRTRENAIKLQRAEIEKKVQVCFHGEGHGGHGEVDAGHGEGHVGSNNDHEKESGQDCQSPGIFADSLDMKQDDRDGKTKTMLERPSDFEDMTDKERKSKTNEGIKDTVDDFFDEAYEHDIDI